MAVVIAQPSEFVGMQLIPHHMRRLLESAAATPPGSQVEMEALGAMAMQQECFRQLLLEVRTSAANGKAAPLQQYSQQQQYHQPQQHQQQQQAYQQQSQQQAYQQQASQQFQQPQQQYQARQGAPQQAPGFPQQTYQRPQNSYARSPTAARPAKPGKQQAALELHRAQGVFDPLVEKAMSLHNEAAGRDGIVKGVREMYSNINDGAFTGSVANDLANLIVAMEIRDMATATQLRDKLVRTTTTGWVQGGSWQWALKQLIMAARG